ncbi:hypothetical protein COU18_01380 [Candidatus Kaiserbacteria bacterium CG10_big_fil_rev_8_21_14_0_10_51_14]|uniref:Uncharacterized protein n=1 Tax=Candidatus Kaiserbacteria bacterium CG10_big_fil_rev_8_21_14_0_10_51_14 TaxID=1974610 RepID=A0A2H0UCG6_9BACT|nr:MAG: hypothetical protein COU18_01380 [Candidatus Kaiserbacteria bacterium CG10_big_fil_rev_8_21_14_0_10_51_14]
MNAHTYLPLLFTIVVIAAVLGMPLILSSSMHYEMGCPFMSGQTAICVSPVLEHLRHWQTAFATILAELLLIAALTLLAMRQWYLLLPEKRFERIRTRSRAPDRPTLLQELFARGILNPKIF